MVKNISNYQSNLQVSGATGGVKL